MFWLIWKLVPLQFNSTRPFVFKLSLIWMQRLLEYHLRKDQFNSCPCCLYSSWCDAGSLVLQLSWTSDGANFAKLVPIKHQFRIFNLLVLMDSCCPNKSPISFLQDFWSGAGRGDPRGGGCEGKGGDGWVHGPWNHRQWKVHIQPWLVQSWLFDLRDDRGAGTISGTKRKGEAWRSGPKGQGFHGRIQWQVLALVEVINSSLHCDYLWDIIYMMIPDMSRTNDLPSGRYARVCSKSLCRAAWVAALGGMESVKSKSIPGSTPLTGEGWKLGEYRRRSSQTPMQFMPRFQIYCPSLWSELVQKRPPWPNICLGL